MKARKHYKVTGIVMTASWLQWGRADEGAETGTCCRTTPAITRFNGAAPMKARKPAEAGSLTDLSSELQWGRADEGAETNVTRKAKGGRQKASMGPRR